MRHYVFAFFMLVTGVTNLMCVKYTDTLKSENIDGNIVSFNQPFLTSWGMFLGQIICSILFYFMCSVGNWFKKKLSDQRLEDDSERPQPYNTVALEGTFGFFNLTIVCIAFFLIRVFIPLGNFDFAGISTGYLY